MIIITRHAPLVQYLVEIGEAPATTLPAGPWTPAYCGRCMRPTGAEEDFTAGARCACPPARVIAHATPEDVHDQDVIGVLPLHLAALARTVTEIPLSLTPADREAMTRGDLPIERLREIAGEPVTYVVTVQI